MTIKIYKTDISPPARCCIIVAELLKLDYTTQEVNIFAGEHMTPEYLKKNPMRTVPIIEDGDFVLADSYVIMPYLISKYGTTEQQEKLYPSDLKIRAIISQRIFFEASKLMAPFRAIVLDLLDGKNAPTEQQIEKMNSAYSVLEIYLEQNKFVAGEQFTIADLSLVAALSATETCVPVHPKYTKIHAWWNLLKQEDWYKNINEPGAAEFDKFIQSIKSKNFNNVTVSLR